MKANGSSDFLIGLQARSAEVHIIDSIMDLNALKAAQGFQLQKSDLKASGNRVSLEKAADFLTILRGDQSHLEMKNNAFSLSNSTDTQLANLSDSESLWEENTLDLFAQAPKNSTAFLLFNTGKHVFRDNIFRTASPANLFAGDENQVLEVINNLLEGWYILFTVYGKVKSEITDLKDLENRKGNFLFQGNNIRQGL